MKIEEKHVISVGEEREDMQKKWDMIIVGGGPGGYVAALRGTQLKKRVVLIERDRIGGTCMNYGCIPTKYLLYQTKVLEEILESKVVEGPLEKLRLNWKKMQEEKQRIVDQFVQGLDFLLTKNGVTLLKGDARLTGERQVEVQTETEEMSIEGDKIILATGSNPAELPFLVPNGKEVITSREALELESVPHKFLIVGAGAIGIELGTLYHRLGSDVSILEIMPTILPGWDKEIVARLERSLITQGLKVFTQMRIEEAVVEKGHVSLKGISLRDQNSFEFKGDKVLLAAGRKANSDDLNSAPLDIILDESGFVSVNPQLETNIPGIYAIGDLIGGKLLAHKASHEGIIAAENVSGERKSMDYKALPMAVYTEPEFSSVGLTEEEAQKKGIKTNIGRFPLRANGRAIAMQREEGVVKIVADEKDKIIGAHILAPNASEIIAEISLAMAKCLRLQDIASSIHIHPTLSEAVMEASMKAKNMAIHILNL